MEKLNPTLATIEQLIEAGQLADAHIRFGEFLRLCEEEISTLAINRGRLSKLDNDEHTGVSFDSFERNRIALGFQLQIDKFKREVLSQYFDTRTQEEFFDSITDRDAVIHQIIDHRLLPKNYLREDQLVEGNSSIVYRLSNAIMQRHAIALVLKLPTLRDEARREISRLTDLRHRNVIKVLDHDLSAFPYFVITEFVYGVTLPKALEISGPRPAPQVIDWLYQLTDALDYLRHKRIFHTNMRPSKIYVDDEWQVMISPFDLGHFSSAEQTYNRYRDVCQYGSPELMAHDGIGLSQSEMCISDQYSLGLLAYLLLTGEDLFKGESLHDILRCRERFMKDKKYRQERLALLPNVKLVGYGGQKLSLNQVIHKLLSENPEGRYPDLHTVLRTLHPLTRADQVDVSRPRQSYRRCLAINKEFINDFYREFVTREKIKGDNPVTFASDFSDVGIKRQSAMLQMAVDLMIEVDTRHEMLHKIMHNENHKRYGMPDFEIFTDVLIRTLKANDPLWSSELEAEWLEIRRKTLLLLG